MATDIIETANINGSTFFSLGRSGLCRTAAEAMDRATAIRLSQPHTESPRGCPSLLDLHTAREILWLNNPRDGGESLRRINAAIEAGPGTAAAWEALDAVLWAMRAVGTPLSPVKQWPTGEKRAAWPHEVAS